MHVIIKISATEQEKTYLNKMSTTYDTTAN